MWSARFVGTLVASLVVFISIAVTYLVHDVDKTYATVNRPTNRLIRPKQLEYTFNVTRQTLDRFGIEKSYVVTNLNFPGPTIFGTVGDTISINVWNNLPNEESLSIHWHGIEQRGSNIMDGAVGVTQCGIPQGSNLTYTFNLTESGTYWWHGHSHGHRVDGLFGALIVDDPKDVHVASQAYDEDVVILLSDYYLEPYSEVRLEYLAPIFQGQEPTPDGGLINGYGVFNCELLLNDRYSCNPKSGKYSEFFLHPNKRYRLRIINTSSLAHFEFSVDDHDLEVIESDGTEVEPVKMHYLPLASGQRYSAIIETGNKKNKSFYMRAKMNDECLNRYNRYLDHETRAIIRYHDSQITDHLNYLIKRKWNGAQDLPQTEPWEDVPEANVCLDLDRKQLVPVKSQQVPAADVSIVINARINKLRFRNNAPFAFINGTSWIPAVGAPNVHVASGAVNVNDTVRVQTVQRIPNNPKWGGDQFIIDVEKGQVVEVIINNMDESPHPFHLHGHKFWVLDTYEPDNMNGYWIEDQINDYQLDNPVLRDTATVPRFGNAVIRFVADNTGIWALHCHMELHMSTGMLLQFAVGMDEFDETIPQAMLDHCAIERSLGIKAAQRLPGMQYEPS